MPRTMRDGVAKSRQIAARKNGAEKSDPHAGSASGEIRLPVRLDLADGTDSLAAWLEAYFAVEVTTAQSSRAVQRRDLGRFLAFMQAEEGNDDRSLWTARLSRAFFDALHKELDADGSRRFSDRRPAAGLVPDGIDHPRGEAPRAVDDRLGRQEEGGGLRKHLGVSTPFFVEVVADRLGAFLADLIAVAVPALLADGDVPCLEVDLREVEVADRGAAHAGLDQGIDDRPVAPGTVALSSGTLVGKFHLRAAAAVS